MPSNTRTQPTHTRLSANPAPLTLSLAPPKPAMQRTPSFQGTLNDMESTLQGMEADPAHHLAGPFLPQTPIEARTPTRTLSPPLPALARSFWADLRSGQWVVEPESSLKVALVPLFLFCVWEALGPTLAPSWSNPLAYLLFIAHQVPGSTPDEPRYMKGWGDLAFVAYHVVVWSFVRQSILVRIAMPGARRFGIKRPAKVERFGEQLYALLYFSFFGAWGIRIMSQLPTWWYRTDMLWRGYPHWDMPAELKRYYLLQAAYWCQQLVVMACGLEKPRKDYYELIAHHAVTLWMIGWSYLINLTRIGNAVYLSMDVPDAFLAAVKLLNYMRFERSQTAVFALFIPIWTYFRLWLNAGILRSVWVEYDLIPPAAMQWDPASGAWLAPWMKYQVFTPILLLLGMNLFWYFLILRIAKRALFPKTKKGGLEDTRSDDEDDGEDEEDEKKN